MNKITSNLSGSNKALIALVIVLYTVVIALACYIAYYNIFIGSVICD